jgi:hypothetical protein
MVLARRVHRVTLAGVSSGRELGRLIFVAETKEIRRLLRRLAAIKGGVKPQPAATPSAPDAGKGAKDKASP